MGKEIEKKFLVKNTAFIAQAKTQQIIRQGYISSETDRTVRVRTKGEKGFLTIKGKTVGITRPEFEYEIPYREAIELLQSFCDDIIEKTRYVIMQYDKAWEVDIFSGTNNGLILAEIELDSEEEEIILPDWIDNEVSDDPRYYNANLAKQPFSKW